MTPRAFVPGGDLEREIVEHLWKHGDATARDIVDVVRARRGIVYTTVAKVLDRLVDKGVVRRRRVGRAFSYHAIARQEDSRRATARRLVEQLAGTDVQPAVAALLGAMEDVSPAMLDALAAELEARRGRGQ